MSSVGTGPLGQSLLDRRDRELLEEVAVRTGLSRAKALRRGLRRVSRDLLEEGEPGASFEGLIGALGDDPTLPEDLAARHDDWRRMTSKLTESVKLKRGSGNRSSGLRPRPWGSPMAGMNFAIQST